MTGKHVTPPGSQAGHHLHLKQRPCEGIIYHLESWVIQLLICELIVLHSHMGQHVSECAVNVMNYTDCFLGNARPMCLSASTPSESIFIRDIPDM